MVEEKQKILDMVITYGLFIGFFIFLVLGILALDADPDFIADKFFGAALCLFLSIFHKRIGFKWYSIFAILVLLLMHHTKLYGNVYYGIQFDMIIHFVGGFCIAVAGFQILSNCEGIGCSNVFKIMFFTIFVTAGIGAMLEIIEYFAYANLPPGEGLLHYGTGDAGEWLDSTGDMVCNFLGAITASTLMAFVYRRKKNLHHLKMFIVGSRR